MQTVMGDKLLKSGCALQTICTVDLAAVVQSCFDSPNTHMFHSTVDNNHTFNLIKCILLWQYAIHHLTR